MGYNNKPKMQKNNYTSNNKYNKNNQKPQYKKNNNTFFNKDEEDIYTPKVYAKKQKPKSQMFIIDIPEYEMDKQRMRNKRENDKKYKDKNKRNFY